MAYRAIGRYVQVTPKKARAVMDLIRGKETDDALDILEGLNKPTARSVKKILDSAIANARSQEDEPEKKVFYISKITADGGPARRKYKAGAMGRAMPVDKRTSHITIEVEVR